VTRQPAGPEINKGNSMRKVGLVVAGAAVALTVAGVAGAQGSFAGTTGKPKAASGAATAKQTTPRCHTKDLSASLVKGKFQEIDQSVVAGAKVSGLQNYKVVFTNRSASTCEMYGYPGADLVGNKTSQWKSRFSLPRAGGRTTVLLAPGGSAHADLRVAQEPNAYQPWQPTTLQLTPPDETTQLNIAWPAGETIAQYTDVLPDGIGLPSYINPVAAGR
jgi:hypothetical protein